MIFTHAKGRRRKNESVLNNYEKGVHLWRGLLGHKQTDL